MKLGDSIVDKQYKLNSLVVMKKPHPCKTNLFQIVRLGADIKIKCVNCGRSILLSRVDFDKKLKKVMEE
jgi:hypothetical protein